MASTKNVVKRFGRTKLKPMGMNILKTYFFSNHVFFNINDFDEHSLIVRIEIVVFAIFKLEFDIIGA